MSRQPLEQLDAKNLFVIRPRILRFDVERAKLEECGKVRRLEDPILRGTEDHVEVN